MDVARDEQLLYGSERRRRLRRLRSWRRHERLSVAAALAEAFHHSAQRGAWRGSYSALRGQVTVRGRFAARSSSGSWRCAVRSRSVADDSMQEARREAEALGADAVALAEAYSPASQQRAGAFVLSASVAMYLPLGWDLGSRLTRSRSRRG